MRKIKTKIIAGILLCTILSSAFIAVTSIVYSQKIANKDAEQILQLTCQEMSTEINATLSRIQQSVDTVSQIVLDQIDYDKLISSSEYVAEYTKNFEAIFREFSMHTDGAICSYIRFNPEFTEPTSGIF